MRAQYFVRYYAGIGWTVRCGRSERNSVPITGWTACHDLNHVLTWIGSCDVTILPGAKS